MKRLFIGLAFLAVACGGTPYTNPVPSVTGTSVVSSPTSVPVPTFKTPAPTLKPKPPVLSSPTLVACNTSLGNPVITGIRYSDHGTFDRIAFDFCESQAIDIAIFPVDVLTEDGSGNVVHLNSPVLYEISMGMADARSMSAGTMNLGLSNVKQLRRIGNFEGVVTYGVGANKLAETSTGRNGNTYYVDIGH